jgi:excisionase family DNA binding protein
VADAVSRWTPYHDLPEWLTPEELQAYLNVSRNTSYELLRSGAVPSQKFGRLIRVPRSALAPKAGNAV